MNDKVVEQLSRQLKVLNFWVSVFGGLVLVSLLIIGILVYKIVSFTERTADQVSDLKDKTTQTLNVQKKLCESDRVGSLLSDKTNACN